MLLDQSMRDVGGTLFRWRSYVLLVFLPLIAWAVLQGEPIERRLGEVWGDLYEAACVAIVFAGLLLRAGTVGFVPRRTSGRNTEGQVASELNTTGVYSLTRNPLYLANCLIYLGIMLMTQQLILSLAFALFLAVYYERIVLAEEAFLLDRFSETYRAWAAEVPAFVPRLGGWRRPALPFSLRTVLRREPAGWLAAIAAIAIIEIGVDLVEGEEELGGDGWLLGLGIAAAIYVLLLVAKQRRLLYVPGR
jgi:protein-S-isoprenylcysteine O-methyltransferase Ste14